MVTRQEAIISLRRRYGANIPLSELQRLPPGQTNVQQAPPQMPPRPTPQQTQQQVRARHFYERPPPEPTNRVEPIKQNIIQERARVRMIQKQVEQSPSDATFASNNKTYTKSEAIRQLKISTQSLNSYEQEVNQYNKSYSEYQKNIDERKAKQEEFFNRVRQIKWPYSGTDNKIPGTGQYLTPDMPISYAHVNVDAEGNVTFVKPNGMPEALWQYQLATDLPEDFRPQITDSSGRVTEISRDKYIQMTREAQDAYLIEKNMPLWEHKNPLGYWFFSIGEVVLKPFEFGGYYIQEALGQVKPTDRYKHQAEFEVYATQKQKEQGLLRFAPFYGIYSDLPTIAATYGGYGIVARAASPLLATASKAYPLATFAGKEVLGAGMTLYTLSELDRMRKEYKGAKTPQKRAEVTGEFLAFTPYMGINYSMVKKNVKEIFKGGAKYAFEKAPSVIEKMPTKFRPTAERMLETKPFRSAKLWSVEGYEPGYSIPLKKTKWLAGEGPSGITVIEEPWTVNKSGFLKKYKGIGKREFLSPSDVAKYDSTFGKATKTKPAKFKEATFKVSANLPNVEIKNIYEKQVYYKPKQSKILKRKTIRFREETLLAERNLSVGYKISEKPAMLKETEGLGSMYRIGEVPSHKPITETEFAGISKESLAYKDYMKMQGKAVYSPEQFPQTYGKKWGTKKRLKFEKRQPFAKETSAMQAIKPELQIPVSLEKPEYVKRLKTSERVSTIKVPASAFKSEFQLEGLAFGSLATQKMLQRQKQNIKQVQIQVPEQIKATLSAQSVKQLQLQQQKMKQVQKTEQITTFAPYARIKQPVLVRTRFSIGIPSINIGIPETKKQPSGYHAYVKGHKREIRVTKQPLLKTEAMGYGAMITDQTVSRYFKVKPSKDPAVSQPQYANQWNTLQYKFKSINGGFEELPQFAMDTTTEQQEQTPEAMLTPTWIGYKKSKTIHKKGKKEFIYIKSNKIKGIKRNKGFKYMKKKEMFI